MAVFRPRHAALAWFAAAATLVAPASGFAADAPHRVMVVGDSLSQGAIGDVTWRYHLWSSLQAGADAGNVDLVGSRTDLYNIITGQFDGGTAYVDPGFDQDHEARWGQRLQTVAAGITATINALPEPPTAMIVGLGTNDASGGAARAETNMRSLIASARAAAPGVDVVLLAPYSPWDASWSTWVNQSYTTSLRSALGRVASSLDTPSQRVVAQSLTSFDARSMTWDGRHPNATGELVLASAAAQGLQQIGIGSGSSLPLTGSWPATAAAPTLTVSDQRVTISWEDATPGAMAYRIQQRRTTAAGSVGAWTHAVQPGRSITSWKTARLVGGDTYEYRVTPVRRSMVGTPGPAASVTIEGAPAPPPRPAKPWWQWW